MSAPAPSMFSSAATAMAEKLGLKMGRANLDEFAATLTELARADRNVIVVTSDSRGSGKLDAVWPGLPKQLVEVGIAEQNLVGITAGLAACGQEGIRGFAGLFSHGTVARTDQERCLLLGCPGPARRHQRRRQLRRPRQHASFPARPRGAARDSQPHHHRSGGQFRDARSHPRRRARRQARLPPFRQSAHVFPSPARHTSSRWAKPSSSATATMSLSSPPAKQSSMPCWPLAGWPTMG